MIQHSSDLVCIDLLRKAIEFGADFEQDGVERTFVSVVRMKMEFIGISCSISWREQEQNRLRFPESSREEGRPDSD